MKINIELGIMDSCICWGYGGQARMRGREELGAFYD